MDLATEFIYTVSKSIDSLSSTQEINQPPSPPKEKQTPMKRIPLCHDPPSPWHDSLPT